MEIIIIGFVTALVLAWWRGRNRKTMKGEPQPYTYMGERRAGFGPPKRRR